jgi:predicted membrane protein
MYMKNASDKRQVPFWVPVSVFVVILVSLTTVYILKSMELQLVLAFPLGLSMLFFDVSWPKNDSARADLMMLLMILPYCFYIALFGVMFCARKWSTFGITCLILAVVLLLNLAGCRHGLSHIQ